MKIAFVFNKQREKSLDEAEFDTPEVVDAISAALKSGNNEIIDIEMTKDGQWVTQLKSVKPDLIFNTAEGFYGIGRESFAPITFEQLKIPYVGSGPYTCFLTLDKFLTKQLLVTKGIPVPEGIYISDKAEIPAVVKDLVYPVFVKPNFEGSSKGITEKSLCKNKEELITYARECLAQFPEGIIVERYIEGKDVTVPYINGLGEKGVLEPIEYVGPTSNGEWIYDYSLKNLNDDKVEVLCPARIDDDVRKYLIILVQKIVKVLGVNDMSRADFRITPSGEVFFIEINPLPSLQPGAGVFAATRLLGLSYQDTINAIVNAAIKRQKVKDKGIHRSRNLIKRDPHFALVYNLRRKGHEEIGYEDEAEFDSANTVNSIRAAIESTGYKVDMIEADRELAQKLTENEIDIVFNIAEGLNKQTREAQVPAVCDLIGVEHTGSDASCLAITLNKSFTSRLMASEGVRVPKSRIIERPAKKIKHDLQYPVIIKPNLEGTSKGIYDDSVVDNDDDLVASVNSLWNRFKSPILCEEYIRGRELTVGLLGEINPQVLGILEVVFKRPDTKYPVYSFEAKQLENQLDNEIFRMECPANLSKSLERKIIRFAKKAFQVSGCRDVARVDIRVNDKEEIFFLEINPLPGLSPGFSDLTIIAEKSGMNYNELISRILRPAVRRWRRAQTMI